MAAFEKMMQWLRGLLPGLFTGGREGGTGLDIAISGEMESAISRWAREYEGRPAWAPDGKSLGLAAGVASELARMATMESGIQMSGSSRGNWLQQKLAPFLDDLQTDTEVACALGGMIFKPYVSDGEMRIDVIQGDCFYPLAFDSSRRLVGAVFVDQIIRDKKIYTRLERHDYAGGIHRIRNLVFESGTPESLGRKISPAAVPEWEGLAEDVSFTGLNRPLFGHLRMPFANRIDRHSPLGVSVYANAENLLRDADAQYGRYIWEFEGGELAIDAAEDYLKPGPDGQRRLPRGKERLFRGQPTQDMNFYQVFSPALRDESIKRGFNGILQRIEFNCGLAYGTLSDPQTVEKTAEEIRTSKQRTYATVKGIQKALQAAIEDLVYAMNFLADSYAIPDAGSGAYDIAFDWDDSIINDPVERKQRYWQFVTAGKFPFWKYLTDFEGYAEEDAKALAAEAAGSLTDPFGFASNAPGAAAGRDEGSA